jgi:hypothetical protein
MQQTIENFLGLSALLTGFSSVELAGTGVTGDYLRALAAALPSGVLEELLDTYAKLPSGAGQDAAIETMLQDAKLGPVAQNLVLLWYTGSWTSLPAAWHTAYGAAPADNKGVVSKGVVSAEAYQAGLQWIAAGAHAPGSAQQGFGAWSLPPGLSTLPLEISTLPPGRSA